MNNTTSPILIDQIEAKLGYCFANKTLILEAFTHRSFTNESRALTEHNERLEFLGDSVLGLMVSSYLFRTFPHLPEGDLSAMRSKLVESSSCISYLQKLNVDQHLLLGKGERLNDGRGRESILSDLFEAIIGAIYLDGGFEVANNFFFDHFSNEINLKLQAPPKNSKAILQDYCQKVFLQHPTYNVISENGPDHIKTFKISVSVKGKELGIGEGASKKEAQQAAANNALDRLKQTGAHFGH